MTNMNTLQPTLKSGAYAEGVMLARWLLANNKAGLQPGNNLTSFVEEQSGQEQVAFGD